jgi:hypothetical protein
MEIIHFQTEINQSDRKPSVPFLWSKLWLGVNYFIGGITFLVGSIVYFPGINQKVNGDVVGGYLYTIGSVGFLLGDIAEWNT